MVRGNYTKIAIILCQAPYLNGLNFLSFYPTQNQVPQIIIRMRLQKLKKKMKIFQSSFFGYIEFYCIFKPSVSRDVTMILMKIVKNYMYCKEVRLFQK